MDSSEYWVDLDGIGADCEPFYKRSLLWLQVDKKKELGAGMTFIGFVNNNWTKKRK